MAIIVSDTSPIRALHHLQLLELASDRYGDLIIPAAVEVELRLPGRNFISIDMVSSGGAVGRTASHSLVELVQQHHLDAGETEAIALAIETRAYYLLIDELAGRRVAAEFGIKTVGVFGVLIEAKRRGIIPRVAPLTARLRNELRFRIQPDFEKKTLATVDEMPDP